MSGEVRVRTPQRAFVLHDVAAVCHLTIGTLSVTVTGDDLGMGIWPYALWGLLSLAMAALTAACMLQPPGVDLRDDVAEARAGLGEACLALSEPERARVHYKQALALYQELDVPEADRIHAPARCPRPVTMQWLADTACKPAAETVTFSIGGRVLEIDLSERNATILRKTLELWRPSRSEALCNDFNTLSDGLLARC
jgi:hypothetical protein